MPEFTPDELGMAPAQVIEQNSNTPVKRVKVEWRIGMLARHSFSGGKEVERFFDTTPERWEEHAETYLRFDPNRIVWLENRLVIETEWYR